MKKNCFRLMKIQNVNFRLVRTPTGALLHGRCSHRPQTKWLFTLFISLLVYSCNSSTTGTSGDTPEARTPVTVTSVSNMQMNEYIELNATSTFIQQNFVKSNLNGYIQKSNIKYGDYVHAGEVLFVLKTKEASAIGNAVNNLDSNFKFSGVMCFAPALPVM